METYTYQNYIGGKWISSSSGETYPSINPANINEILGYFQKSDANDVHAAVEAAQKAFPKWSATPAPVRGDILFNIIKLLEERQEELARLITREVGKTLREARKEVLKTIQAMKQFSGEATRLTGETADSYSPDVFACTVKEPLGVVAVIAPFNFPLGIGMWKIAPALIAGNTVVFKPASQTSLISVRLVEMFVEAGVPPGVLNMVTGPGSVIGREISRHPQIKAVSFTGSTEVGMLLNREVTARGGKMQAEMGGKNPTIILEDADFEQAVNSIVISGMLDNGQRCTGTSRVIVPRSIAGQIKQILIERAQSLKFGNGFNPDVDNGPLIDEHQLNRYLHYVQTAIDEGAVLEYGGKRLTDGEKANGYFVAPTIFSKVTPHMTIAREEIFGPVIALMEVDSYEEAIEVANDIDYGLSSSLFTNDLNKAFYFLRHIQSGVAHVNMPSTHFENHYPFGGKKGSSIGPREQGSSALDFWVETKTIYIQAAYRPESVESQL